MTSKEASNIATTSFSEPAGRLAQHLEGSVRLSHNQRKRSAQPMILRSKSPKPPRSVERQTRGQATEQCTHHPPETVADPFQRKPHRSLSMALIAQTRSGVDKAK
ncbi:hypothetical protein C2845_PM07G32870 [Panicum miliaceum]|uniref:Uncharacterized protein n=1 Tax=Panicum miliaceum TaxID=4540 RepID=A0A3L6SIQ3_PANMI|nr:hypothetical protein C2845_PM07G32870 [Panicum miliaceum]